MDRSIPAAAQALLTFIYKGESNVDYNKQSASAEKRNKLKVTGMSINDVLSVFGSSGNRKKWGMISSAVGAPQFINKTLAALKKQMGLTGKEKLDANMQDRLAYQLLRNRGYDAWVSGRIDTNEFAKRLAQEWASLPVLAGTKNARGQNIKRGAGYYDGDGLNSAAHVKTEQWEHVLYDALYNKQAFVNVKAADTPVAASTKVAVAVGSGAAVVGGAAEATKAVTDWQPVIELASTIGKYGPAVAGGAVLLIVGIVVWRKVWK